VGREHGGGVGESNREGRDAGAAQGDRGLNGEEVAGGAGVDNGRVSGYGKG